MDIKMTIGVLIAGVALFVGGFVIGQRTSHTPSLFAKPAAVAALSGEQICSRDLKQHVQFKDPDSVRVNSIQPNGVNGTNEHLYMMSVSAKNSYGGYGDPMRCSCSADLTTGRVTYLFCGS